MSFDAPPIRPQRIAVIGGGVSGLAAAWLLSPQNEVTLYESEPRLGGHARTVMAGRTGDQPVDTGFIVFNYETYPHFTAMLDKLDVPVAKSDMSFGATIDGGKVEYSLQNLNTIFGQRRNVARPAFVKMIRDLVRFNAEAEAAADSDDITIADLVAKLGLGDWFAQYYLMPICGAIWSTPTMDVGAFPARTLVNFFKNHSLLGWKQHQWMTIDGGSVEYVRRMTDDLRMRGVTLRPGTPVRSVTRKPGQVRVEAKGAPAETFDQVIFATHSDDTLRLLADPTPAERAALGNLNYQDNRAFLHSDPGQMPNRRRCWSSWTYKAETQGDHTQIGVTYWMNRLQNIPENDPMFISLNPSSEIREELIYDEVTFRHPVFDRAALRAQKELKAIQGDNGTWFAGAYTRHGFHEDGFASAAAIAEAMDRAEQVIAA
ncbi:FAD-dependent oxidoreductase [Maritimibacter sp. UBA3975]|uniref:NAD(P)/FAD-dependent oxidoreductase n=1 Tax=Maritimibacter sp. UBA3975 TaxID=1946833 RepID=UPI000C0B21CE|nr:FAD-dependent oxidoreductase [Maritimibacter sp. UBA3975]MAM63391.1 cyclopropane-fatty-acyl-phospholipid synthase [Maritimibacter sp.]|tara:strand:+ start:89880 stop:91169 length:1290 start_codon:yes stop_codon:yes gene_type:complete